MADAADESTTSVPYRGLRVLSLDGGGVRGLSGLMILKYMMEGINANNPPRPSDVFDLICGTSTGGLIAIMLGRLRMTVKEAIDAYIELSETVFAPKHRFNFAANLWNLAHAKGSCDTAALEKAIKGVTAQKLGVGHTEDPLHERHAQCHVFVCAIRAGKRSLIKFRNYAAEGTDDLEPKIWEAARATSAATTFFDPITIGKYKQEFVDGGAEQNNPVQEAHDEAKAYWKDRDIECVVSIGTGLSPLEAFGRSLKDVGKTLVKIATETDKTHALFAKNHPQYPQYTDEAPVKRLFRFQVARGLENVGMAEHKKISDIADATQNYMEHEAEAGTKQLQYFKALISGHSE